VTVIGVSAPLGWLGPGRIVEDVLVVIDGGVIAFAGEASALATITEGPNGPETLDGQPAPPEPEEEILFGGFVMPGVVDRHVHIEMSDPGAVVAGGVTAVRDLGWPPDAIFSLVEASESPAFNGPLIRAAGPILTCHGGYPTRAGWAPTDTGLEVGDAEEAERAARWLLDRGAAILKVALNSDAGPTLSDDALVAICDVAHEAETIVTAHVQGVGQAARAVGAGVDEFAHCPWSERLSDDLIRAAARRMRIVSTLDIHSYGQDTPELRTASENLSRFVAEGGRVAYGTDLGNGPIPPGIHAREAEHLARAGLSNEAVLEALTFRPLAPGEPADVVGLGTNPLERLDALRDVEVVLRAGRRVR
jgi:imidazolonepropionase-like amidohydrolase